MEEEEEKAAAKERMRWRFGGQYVGGGGPCVLCRWLASVHLLTQCGAVWCVVQLSPWCSQATTAACERVRLLR